MLSKLISFFSMILLLQCTCGERAQPIDPPVQALEMAADVAIENPIFEYTEVLPDDWWILFQDGQLTDCIQTALTQNPTLQAAQAKIYLAKAMADRARSTLFPNLSWGGDILREKLSTTGLIPFGEVNTGVTPLP